MYFHKFIISITTDKKNTVDLINIIKILIQ